MSRTNRHGLWGRERRAFHQGRVADMCMKEMIAEYVKPSSDRKHNQRSVPIRHKGEFVQASQSSLEIQMTIDNTQLDLPYATNSHTQSNTRTKSRDQVGHKHGSKHSRADQSIDGVLLLKPSGSPHSKRFDTANHHASSITTRAMKPTRYAQTSRRSHRTNSSLTWSGFLYGCLIGGAAAAIALVLLDFTVL